MSCFPFRGFAALTLGIALFSSGCTEVRYRASAAPEGYVGELWCFRGHTEMIHQVAFSPDGHYVATASADGTARVLDVETGQQVSCFSGHGDLLWHSRFILFPSLLVNSHAYPPGGMLLIYAAVGCVNGVAFSPDSRHVATAGQDGTVRVWDRRTGWQVQSLVASEHRGVVESLAVSSDGESLATVNGREAIPPDETGHIAEDGKIIRVWSLKTGKEVRRWQWADTGVSGVAFRGAHQVVFTSRIGGIVLADIVSGELHTVMNNGRGASSPCLSRDGKRLLFIGLGEVGILDLVEKWILQKYAPESPASLAGSSAAWSQDERYVLVPVGECRKPDALVLVELATGRELCRLEGQAAPSSIAISPDGRFAVSAGMDRTVRLWKLPSANGVASQTSASGPGNPDASGL